MEISFNKVSENVFEASQAPILVGDNKTDRIFSIISNGFKQYKLSWQSTGIKPVILPLKAGIYALGIDLSFIIFEFETGNVITKFVLNYFLYDLKLYNNYVYVITEMEIILIDTKDYSKRNTYHLPDIVGKVNFDNDYAFVKCLNGQVIKIPS